jgi:hypothetical protein
VALLAPLPAPPLLLLDPEDGVATRNTWLLRFMIVPISYLQPTYTLGVFSTGHTCRVVEYKRQ